ncbi:MAG: molybdenum cofactor biosynthesis protein [Infirmifilum uzonense]|jgi:molybdopterin synthase catalytic subunit|uniref:Molybdopterin converting factor n=1 Tax=Infirmifilum uzonense TaxID=1550241 RepID=A0A0F7FIN5_9CREN|nr:molybdenum cofactor biosynthesis protein MoaE [Infirmifilum uzonense]AKG39243.1 hypothetical protein MA03_08420 [Infirmifilum uzonense]
MQVKIRYLSLFRDLVGKGDEVLEIQGQEATVKTVLDLVLERHPSLKDYFEAGEIIIVNNGRVLQVSDKVAADSELILMPPVSGGSPYAFIDRVDPVLILDGLLKALDDGAGAVAIFIGRVKGKVQGKSVNELYYEALEPLATSTLTSIGEEEAKKHSLIYSTIYHKKGSAKPGEPVLFIGVASERRDVALRALRDILERVKHEVYVWKLEKREDGEFWILGDGRRIPRPYSAHP